MWPGTADEKGMQGMTTQSERRYLRPEDAPAILARAGTTMSVPEAAACMGVTESTAYNLVKAGEFPLPVLRLGRQMRVATAEVRRALGLPIEKASA